MKLDREFTSQMPKCFKTEQGQGKYKHGGTSRVGVKQVWDWAVAESWGTLKIAGLMITF